MLHQKKLKNQKKNKNYIVNDLITSQEINYVTEILNTLLVIYELKDKLFERKHTEINGSPREYTVSFINKYFKMSIQ